MAGETVLYNHIFHGGQLRKQRQFLRQQSQRECPQRAPLPHRKAPHVATVKMYCAHIVRAPPIKKTYKRRLAGAAFSRHQHSTSACQLQISQPHLRLRNRCFLLHAGKHRRQHLPERYGSNTFHNDNSLSRACKNGQSYCGRERLTSTPV